MSAKQTTIVINGRVYDAISGLPLKKPLQPTVVVHNKAKPPHHTQPTQSSHTEATHTKRSTHQKAARATTVHVRTKGSQTLMRTGVKKPTHHTVKANGSISYSVPVRTATKAHHVAPDKLARAQTISKSAAISKFGTHGLARVIKKQSAISVKSAPTHTTPAATQQQHIPAPTRPVNHIATERILHNALVNASSHQAPKLAAQPKRRVNALAIVAIVVILSGFIGMQNSAKISYAMAAKQAGVAMQFPGAAPAGFSLSNAIDYSHGLVSFRYLSHNDDRWIQVNQQVSSYKDSTELENAVAKDKSSYQRIEKNDVTLFVSGNKTASWLRNGNLFTLTGNTELSTEQISRVASLR